MRFGIFQFLISPAVLWISICGFLTGVPVCFWTEEEEKENE